MSATRRWLFAAALVLALPAAVRADGDLPKELAEIEQRFQGSTKPRGEAYAEARSEFEKFAAAHAGTEAGLKAKLWVLQNAWWLRDDKGTMEDAAAKVADEILKEYPKSEEIAHVAEWSYVFRKEKHAELLAALAAAERPAAVRAAAGLASAIRLKRAGDAAKARPLFEAIAKEFGDLKKGYTTYGAMADAYLNAHAPGSLKVGKTAPEIIGVSHDGKPMKLSDYNGRVVVLDFFGDW